jgi:hypothetical protein
MTGERRADDARHLLGVTSPLRPPLLNLVRIRACGKAQFSAETVDRSS